MNYLDISILIAYFVSMILMGVYFSRKNKGTEEYFVGGRSYSGWLIGISMVGTYISSITFVSYPADTFKTSWMRFIPALMLPAGTWIGAYVFLPFFRKSAGFSAYEYLEHRFGPSIRIYGSLSFIVIQVARLAIMLYLLALLFAGITHTDPLICILVCGVIVAFYTVLGGLDAVIWTDVVQTFILILGSIICIGVIIFKLPGGIGELFSVAWQHNKLSICDFQNGQLVPIDWGLTFSRKTGTMLLLLGLTYWLTTYGTSQTTIQRYYATKTLGEARRSMWIATWGCLPVWAFYMFMGTALYVFFVRFPSQEATDILNGVRKAEEIVPFFVNQYLPHGLVGLVIAAALAAGMSSISSGINSISTSFVVDLYKRFFVKERGDKHYLRIAFIVSIISSVLMIGGAIIFIKAKMTTLQDMFNVLFSILGGGVLGIYMLGFFTRLADAKAVLFGILCTMVFTGWSILLDREMLPRWLSIPFDSYYVIIVGNLLTFAAAALVGLIWPRKKPLEAGLNVWDVKKSTEPITSG